MQKSLNYKRFSQNFFVWVFLELAHSDLLDPRKQIMLAVVVVVVVVKLRRENYLPAQVDCFSVRRPPLRLLRPSFRRKRRPPIATSSTCDSVGI